MLLDPVDWSLAQRGDEVLSQAGDGLAGNCAAETHEAALELRTAPHATVRDAIAEMRELRACWSRDLVQARHGRRVRRHVPGSDAPSRPECLPPAATRSSTARCAGSPDASRPSPCTCTSASPTLTSAIKLVNQLRAHLPMLLALSASSPFLRGQSTGLASNRTILFQGFPRTGIPRRFDSYADWVETVDLLVRSGAIPEPTFLWWDIRPQPRLGTVEIRIMDAQPRLAATAALAALVQALARLELEAGLTRPPASSTPRRRWPRTASSPRATRPPAELIDPVRCVRVPVAQAARRRAGRRPTSRRRARLARRARRGTDARPRARDRAARSG